MLFLMSSTFVYQIPSNDPHQNYNVTTNTFFLTFWQNGIPQSFILLIALRWAIAIVGASLNLILFLVILMNRLSLHGTCNMLIAINAVLNVIFELSLTIGLVLQLLGFHFINLTNCFLLQAVPIFCRNMVITTLLAIAVDRLFSVWFAIWHIGNGQRALYRTILLSMCIGHSLYFLVISTQMAIQMPELREACLSSDDAYQGDHEALLFMINTIILLLILLCYLFIWAFLRIRADNGELGTTKRIIKSLTLTASTVSIGWLSYNGIQAFLLPAFSSSMEPIQAAYLTFGSSYLPYIAMAFNAPMLFLFSKDYRAALVKSFKWIHQCKSGTTVNPLVTPLAGPFQSSKIPNSRITILQQSHARISANLAI